MKLWIFDSQASHDDIEAGCRAAAALIEKRGVSVERAYDAVLKRSARARYDQRAAKAWDDGEDEALRVTYHGAEPDDEPVLGPASERDVGRSAGDE
jgi:hypothetical protein